MAAKISGTPQRPPVGAEEVCCSLVGDDESSTKAGIYYSDVDVCRLLGIKRRIIAQARTMTSRGKNWGCVGEHAGMSRDWCAYRLLELGKPVTDLGKIKPIDNDGIVSVKLLGTWPNVQRVTVEIVADGSKAIASVRDSREMHLGDIFDCRRYSGNLCMDADINACVY